MTPHMNVWDILYNVREALQEFFRYIIKWLPIKVEERHRTTWNKHSRSYSIKPNKMETEHPMDKIQAFFYNTRHVYMSHFN